jgi:hypothetical protein
MDSGEAITEKKDGKKCCGAGAESRGAEIKLPPVAGAEITHLGSGSFLFTTDMKKFYRTKSWLLKNFL